MDDPGQFGRELAERIIAQAKRYGLDARDMGVMFDEEVEKRSRMMELGEYSGQDIETWTEAAVSAFRLRVDEETRARK